MLFLPWTHLFEFQLVKHFLITILSSLIYLRENTGNSTRSRPICTLFSQWINELTLWMSFKELVTDTCPPSSHLPSLSHLYCCFQASTVVCNYLFLAWRFPTRRETPPLCTSKSSELRQVAFQRGAQHLLNEWRCHSLNSISEAAGCSPVSGQWGYHHTKATCLAESGFLPILPSLSFSDLLRHLIFRIGKEVEEQRKSMQKLRHSTWHIADTQQWPATLMARLQTAVWGHEVTLEGLQCLLKSPHGSIPLCPVRFALRFRTEFPLTFSLFSYNGKWSIKICARSTAFIMDLWRDVGI